MRVQTKILLLTPLILKLVASWAPSQRIGRFHKPLGSSAVDPDVMEGTSTFEDWFASVQGASLSSALRHEAFGNLRGLSISETPASSEESIITVPKSIVQTADFSKPDWDAELAQKIWFECAKGTSSPISGYVALLTRGWTPAMLPELPPDTAPDALRHWTDEQKSVLVRSSAGKKLLDLKEKQEKLWQEKFTRVKGMTYEQFQWAMEVVHSRAFQGDFGIGGSPIPPIANVVVPVVAAISGAAYYYQNPQPSDVVMLSLGFIAALPTVVSLVAQSPPVAVLLPMIDSINHLEEADSTISYSPLSDSFSLSIGSKCVVEEGDKKQLYVSYGVRKDTELLLNYGFLKGVSSDGDSSTRRRALADAFLARNDQV